MKSAVSLHSAAAAGPDFFSPQVCEARRFYLDLTPPKGRPLTVVCGGAEHTTADYAIHRQSFPFYSIEYVVRGKGEVKLNGHRHPLQPGRLFSYGPSIAQDIRGEPAEPMVKYFVDFSGRQAPSLLRSCGLAPGQVSEVFPPTVLQPLFDELIRCGLRGTPHSQPLCARLLECLALEIAESRAPVAGADSLAFSTYQQARQYIQQHFRQLRTLEQISAECHVNNAYLCRLFRKFDHQSPYQYLLRLKMNLAAELLQQPGALVKQVGASIGFADPFHFSRSFKTVFGLAPEAFRRLR